MGKSSLLGGCTCTCHRLDHNQHQIDDSLEHFSLVDLSDSLCEEGQALIEAARGQEDFCVDLEDRVEEIGELRHNISVDPIGEGVLNTCLEVLLHRLG